MEARGIFVCVGARLMDPGPASGEARGSETSGHNIECSIPGQSQKGDDGDGVHCPGFSDCQTNTAAQATQESAVRILVTLHAAVNSFFFGSVVFIFSQPLPCFSFFRVSIRALVPAVSYCEVRHSKKRQLRRVVS